MIQRFKQFEGKPNIDIMDDLKANFRSYEIDNDNYEDTTNLTNILASRHPNMSIDVIYKIAKEWTGYEEQFENKTNENFDSDNVIFEETLTYTDIDLIYDHNLYADIETVEAKIRYKIDVEYKKYGISAIYANSVTVDLYIVFKDEEENEIPKEYHFDNVEIDTTDAKIPFHPDNLDVDLKDNKILVNF